MMSSWIEVTLGSPPSETLFETSHLSDVVGVRLKDGREIVVKVRGSIERAAACVAGQAALHADGFPCPKPLTAVTAWEGRAVHAEQYVPGVRRAVEPSEPEADRFALLLADLIARSRRLQLPQPHPALMWLAWDHDGPNVWPKVEAQPPYPEAMASAPWLTDVAARVRARLSRISMERVVAHGDWEAQNMAWHGDRLRTVHDWDSLATRPEAAFAGAAAATFASGAQPVLVPLDVSARFLDTYQAAAGRKFTAEEHQIAWATGLWLAAHNARMELLYDKPHLVLDRMEVESRDRSQLAGA
jgi:hypothetical protein